MEIKKKTGLYVLLIILGVLVLVLGGYAIYNKMHNSNTTTNNPSKSDTKTLVSKLNDSKDWVYDAEYTKSVNAESYSTLNETYYAKDIVVPYINVDSSYAKTSNDKIKKYLMKL